MLARWLFQQQNEPKKSWLQSKCGLWSRARGEIEMPMWLKEMDRETFEKLGLPNG